jgi:hypothetical protein
MAHQPDNKARDELAEKAQPAVKEHTARSAEQATRDPAEERGERMESGKSVARSGKSTGQVPGASHDESHR